jgi:hypothetical protein
MGNIEQRTISCSCKAVVLELQGSPIGCAVCYCDTCQEGSQRIETLPNALPVREAAGGTAYVLYRKDRVKCTKGSEHLKDYRLNRQSSTNRVVASCCNSALMMRFDDARHWIPIYRTRFEKDPPPVELRISTGYVADKSAIPKDVPAYESFAPSFLAKLLWSRIAMVLHV